MGRFGGQLELQSARAGSPHQKGFICQLGGISRVWLRWHTACWPAVSSLGPLGLANYGHFFTHVLFTNRCLIRGGILVRGIFQTDMPTIWGPLSTLAVDVS